MKRINCKVAHPALFQVNNYVIKIDVIKYVSVKWCNMFRPYQYVIIRLNKFCIIRKEEYTRCLFLQNSDLCFTKPRSVTVWVYKR